MLLFLGITLYAMCYISNGQNYAANTHAGNLMCYNELFPEDLKPSDKANKTFPRYSLMAEGIRIINPVPYRSSIAEKEQQCTGQCFYDSNCNSFTFSPVASGGYVDCQFFAMVIDTSIVGNVESYPGSKYFVRDYCYPCRMMPESDCLCDCRIKDQSKSDCADWMGAGHRRNGYYYGYRHGKFETDLCEMSYKYGGWNVVQHRFLGNENFDRLWDDYRDGFGEMKGDFWIGNEWLHQFYMHTQIDGLTNVQFRMTATDFGGRIFHYQYEDFRVYDESKDYELFCAGEENKENVPTTVMRRSLGKFQTTDRKQSGVTAECPVMYESGWWFGDIGVPAVNSGLICGNTNFNGPWSNVQQLSTEFKGMIWNNVNGTNTAMRSTALMLRIRNSRYFGAANPPTTPYNPYA